MAFAAIEQKIADIGRAVSSAVPRTQRSRAARKIPLRQCPDDASSAAMIASKLHTATQVFAEECEDPRPRILGRGLVIAESADAHKWLGGELRIA